jgi:hypothetical protein
MDRLNTLHELIGRDDGSLANDHERGRYRGGDEAERNWQVKPGQTSLPRTQRKDKRAGGLNRSPRSVSRRHYVRERSVAVSQHRPCRGTGAMAGLGASAFARSTQFIATIEALSRLANATQTA